MSFGRIYALTRPVDSGIGGGVVSQKYFKEHFGLLNPDGSTNTAKSDNVSSLVVSVLQAGAFFGALGSAPISGERLRPSLRARPFPFSLPLSYDAGTLASAIFVRRSRRDAWRGTLRWSVRFASVHPGG